MTTVKVVVLDEKLGANNWSSWSASFKALLGMQTPSLESTLKTAPANDAQNAASSLALNLMTLNVQPQHRPFLGQENMTAYKAWQYFTKLYASKDAQRVLTLRTALTNLRMLPNETMTEYLSRARNAWIEYTAAGETMDDRSFICSILNGLDQQQYDSIITAITTSGLQDADAVCSALMQYAERVGSNKGSGTPAFGALGSNNRGANPSTSTNPDAGKECHYCHKIGHIAKDCRKKKRDQQQGGGKNGKGGKGGNSGKGNPPKQSPAFAATSSIDVGFYLDSASVYHVCNDTNKLINIRPLTPAEQGISILGISGHPCSAEAAGQLVIAPMGHPPVTINDVYYFPSAVANLLSYGKLKSKGAIFKDYPSHIMVCTSDGTPAFKAYEEDGVYIVPKALIMPTTSLPDNTVSMDPLPYPPAPGYLASPKAKCADAQLWHRRLGHLGYNSLARMASKQMVHGMPVPPWPRMCASRVCWAR